MIKTSKSIFDELAFEGEWWLPETPEKVVYGSLKGSITNELILKTTGWLSDDPDDYQKQFIILGKALDGELITLLQCFPFNWTQNFSTIMAKPPKAKYFAHWVLIGHHFSNYQDLKFSKIEYGVSNLEDWHSTKSFDFIRNSSHDAIEIKYTKPNDVNIYDSELFKIDIKYLVAAPIIKRNQKVASIEHAARILISPKSGQIKILDFDDDHQISYFEIMGRLNSFFSFAIFSNVFSYDIIGYVSNESSANNDKKVIIHRIHYKPIFQEKIEWHKMHLLWSHISDNPSIYIANWLNKVNDIGQPIWLYLGSFKESVYQDQKFMELVQALEGYHRIRHPEKSIASEDHLAKIRTITEPCPPEHLKWLESKLKRSHEPSLSERLRGLVIEFKDLIDGLTGSSKNTNKLIDTIVQSRNNYAHCLNKGEKEFARKYRYKLINLMQKLIATWFTYELGFNKEQVEKIIRSNWNFRQLTSYFAEDEI